ncbi:MAG: 30S ribosomal protein S2 [Myxococcales bacterium]|jgi:small subunit ribosomal protein S2|nr:30S ribosomal protein S2 [Myxococcales bacterium]
MSNPGLKELLDAGVHFGHQTGRWNPKMRPFIYGARGGVHIIDLSKTVRLLDRGLEAVANTVAQGKSVLFVGTKKQAQEIVKEEASRARQHYITSRWLGGTLTNWATMKGRVERLKELERMATDGSFEKYTKKEALMLEREREKLERNVGGVKHMNGLPGLIFVIDPRKEEIAVQEANRLGIPVMAITDTNCDPDGIEFVVPGNDDAIRSITLFAKAISDACIEGSRRAPGGGGDRNAASSNTTWDAETRSIVQAGGNDVEVRRKGAAPAEG